MAGDWIKMETNLHEKPEVIRIASELGKTRFDVVGRLHRLWAWFDSHSADGHAKGVTSVTLDEIVSCDGFANALIKVDWLVQNLESLSLPKFDRHNGKSAKSRAEACDRQRMSRENRDTCHTKTVTDALPEKRREEKNIKKPQVAIELPFPSTEFAAAWNLWLTHKKEIGQKMPPTTIKAQLAKCSKWGESKAIRAIEDAIAAKWQGLFEPKDATPTHRPLYDEPTYRKNGTYEHRPLWD